MWVFGLGVMLMCALNSAFTRTRLLGQASMDIPTVLYGNSRNARLRLAMWREAASFLMARTQGNYTPTSICDSLLVSCPRLPTS